MVRDRLFGEVTDCAGGQQRLNQVHLCLKGSPHGDIAAAELAVLNSEPQWQLAH